VIGEHPVLAPAGHGAFEPVTDDVDKAIVKITALSLTVGRKGIEKETGVQTGASPQLEQDEAVGQERAHLVEASEDQGRGVLREPATVVHQVRNVVADEGQQAGLAPVGVGQPPFQALAEGTKVFDLGALGSDAVKRFEGRGPGRACQVAQELLSWRARRRMSGG
jgi:hypothetical protein